MSFASEIEQQYAQYKVSWEHANQRATTLEEVTRSALYHASALRKIESQETAGVSDKQPDTLTISIKAMYTDLRLYSEETDAEQLETMRDWLRSRIAAIQVSYDAYNAVNIAYDAKHK